MRLPSVQLLSSLWSKAMGWDGAEPSPPWGKAAPSPKLRPRGASEGAGPPLWTSPGCPPCSPHLALGAFLFPWAKQMERTMERTRRMRRVSPSPSPTPSPSPSLLMWVWQRSPEERNQGTSGQLWEKTRHGKGPGHPDPAPGGHWGSGSFRSPAGFPGSFPEVGRRWESQPHAHGLGSRVGAWGSRIGVQEDKEWVLGPIGVLEDKEWVLGSKVGGWRSRVGCGVQKLGSGSQGLGVEGKDWVWGTEVGICRAKVGFGGTRIGFWGSEVGI